MKETPNNEIMMKVALNYIIAGYLYHDGDVESACQALREVANDYMEKWKEETK